MADNKELEELRRQVADLEDLLAMQGGVLRKRIERLERRLGMPPDDAPAQAPPVAPPPPLPDAPPSTQFPPTYPGPLGQRETVPKPEAEPKPEPKPVEAFRWSVDSPPAQPSRAPQPTPAAPKPAPKATPEEAGKDWERLIGTKVLPVVGALLFLVAMGFAVALAIENQALSLPVQFGLELAVCAVVAGVGFWRLKDGSSFGQTLLATGLGGAFLSVAGAYVFKGVIQYEAMIPAFAVLGVAAAAASTIWPVPVVHLIGFTGAMIAAAMPIRNGDPTATVLLGAMAHAAGFGPLFRRPRPALAHLHMAMAGLFGVWCLTYIAPSAAPWKALSVIGLPVLAWALYCRVDLGQPKPRTWMAGWLAPPFFFAALAAIFSDPKNELDPWRWSPWVFGLGAAAIAAGLLGRSERRLWAAGGAALMLTLTGPLSAPMPQAHWIWLSIAVLSGAAAWLRRGHRTAALAGLVGVAAAAFGAAASLNPGFATAAGSAATAVVVLVAAAGLIPNWRRPQRVMVSGAIVAFVPASHALALAQNPDGFRPELAFWMTPAFAMLMLAAAALLAWKWAAWAGLAFCILASGALNLFPDKATPWSAGVVMALSLAGVGIAWRLKPENLSAAAILGGIALVCAPLPLPSEPKVVLQLAFAAGLAAPAFFRGPPHGVRLTGAALSSALALFAFFVLGFSLDNSLNTPWLVSGIAGLLAAAAAVGRTQNEGEKATIACGPFVGLLVGRVLDDNFGEILSIESIALWCFLAASVIMLGLGAWRRWRYAALIGLGAAVVSAVFLNALGEGATALHAALIMALGAAGAAIVRRLDALPLAGAALAGGAALAAAPFALPLEPRVALLLAYCLAFAVPAFVKAAPKSLRLIASLWSAGLAVLLFLPLALHIGGSLGAPWIAAGIGATLAAASAMGRTFKDGEKAALGCAPLAGWLFGALLRESFGPALSVESVGYWSLAAVSVALLGLAYWRRWRHAALMGAVLTMIASIVFIGQRMNSEAATLAQGGSMVVLGLAAMAGLVRGWGSKGWCWAAPVAVIWPGWSMLVAEGMRRAFAVPEAASFSAAWSSLALAALAAGFAFSQRSLRGVGLALFGCVSVKVLLVDLSELEAWIRVLAVGVVALLLLAGGWLYVRRELGRRKAEPTVERPPD